MDFLDDDIDPYCTQKCSTCGFDSYNWRMCCVPAPKVTDAEKQAHKDKLKAKAEKLAARFPGQKTTKEKKGK
jgi:hypothetical protein